MAVHTAPLGSPKHPLTSQNHAFARSMSSELPGKPMSLSVLSGFRAKPCIVDGTHTCRFEIARKLTGTRLPQVDSVAEIHRDARTDIEPWEDTTFDDTCVRCRQEALRLFSLEKIDDEAIATYVDAVLAFGKTKHPQVVARVAAAMEHDAELAATVLEVEHLRRSQGDTPEAEAYRRMLTRAP